MKTSAGLLIYRRKNGQVQVLLVHPGGPFWARKDAWGIPKGEYFGDEAPLAAAKREFSEETGLAAPAGDYVDLGEVKTGGGKTIFAFAVEADPNLDKIKSNTVSIEWPPRSGRQLEVPEIDKAAWKDVASATAKMHKGQAEFISRLADHLGVEPAAAELSQGSLF